MIKGNDLIYKFFLNQLDDMKYFLGYRITLRSTYSKGFVISAWLIVTIPYCPS